MVNPRGSRGVVINAELARIFEKIQEEERKKRPTEDVGLATVVQEYLRKALYYEEQMELAKDHIDYRGPVDNNRLLFYDKDWKRTVMIQIKEKCLFCEEDNTDNCRHVGFAWTIPEVAQKLREHGWSKPKPTIERSTQKEKHEESINHVGGGIPNKQSVEDEFH